jgi:hypothetical protein
MPSLHEISGAHNRFSEPSIEVESQDLQRFTDVMAEKDGIF